MRRSPELQAIFLDDVILNKQVLLEEIDIAYAASSELIGEIREIPVLHMQ